MDYAPNVQAVRLVRARGAAADSRRALRDRRPQPGAGGARAGRRAGDRDRRGRRHARLARRRRCRGGAAASSPAASRTRCWRRWRWPGRWSPRRPPSRGSRPSPAATCSSPTMKPRPPQAINGLLADPARAAAMGAAARRQMERAYRWEARLAPLAEMVDPGEKAGGMSTLAIAAGRGGDLALAHPSRRAGRGRGGDPRPVLARRGGHGRRSGRTARPSTIAS